jgi:hypothetical protein
MKRFLLLILFLTFLLSACDAGYQEMGGRWVFIEYNESAGKVVREIEGADPATFEPLDREYGRDRQRVYHRQYPIEGADPASFEHVGGLFWKDRYSAYYAAQPIPGSDPDSFRTLRYGYWSRDEYNVYVGTDPVNPRDLDSFRQISEQWARDDTWFYAQNYGKYQPFEELDLATFQILQGAWAKDCCRVFWLGNVVEGADPATFTTINQFRGQDKAWTYLMGTRQRTIEEERALQERNKNQP